MKNSKASIFITFQALEERERDLKQKEEQLRQREDEETKRQILFGRMLDERKTKEEEEIQEERRRLQNERIRIAEDYRRYEASSRLAFTPIPDDDSAYSSSREPSRGSVSIQRQTYDNHCDCKDRLNDFELNYTKMIKTKC